MAEENLDYKNLPFHIPYEGIHREASMSFHTLLNEPFRFDDNKLNQYVNQKISFWTDPTVNFPRSLLSLRSQDIHGGFDFREKFTNPNLMIIGSAMVDGSIVARMKYDFSDRLTLKNNTQLSDQTWQTMFSYDYSLQGLHGYITQLQFGTNIPYKASFSKSVTPKLSLHGEVSWNVNGKKEVGFAARYEAKNPKMVVVAQVSTRCAMMSYFHKITAKVSFVAYHMYNYLSRDRRVRVGSVYSWRRGRLLANIDSNGVFAIHLEEQWVKGLSIILSTELQLQYEGLEHWLFSLNVPLSPTQSPTIVLSASADWNGNALKCSFEKEEDMGFSITSQCQINFKDATKSVCSVGLGKKWEYEEQLHRGLQVIFDTRDVTTVIFSQSLTQKFSLQLSAKGLAKLK